LENEIKKNKALRKQNYELNDVLNGEKRKNTEFVNLQKMNKQLKKNNEFLMKEENQLDIDLNNGKKRNTEVINGLNIKCDNLSKKLENQIKTNCKLTEGIDAIIKCVF
jgi:hypothetical protein